jgi:hypothetical protein
VSFVRDTPNLFIVGMDDDSWEEFSSWFAQRRLCAPVRPNDGFVVCTSPKRGEVLYIAGVCIYPTDGPYAVVEHVSTNPKASLRLRHQAVVMGAVTLCVYGATRKKEMMCFPRQQGVERILERAGFIKSPVPLLQHGAWA